MFVTINNTLYWTCKKDSRSKISKSKHMIILVIYRPCQTALQKALQIYIPIIKQCPFAILVKSGYYQQFKFCSSDWKKKMFLVDFSHYWFCWIVQHPSIHLLVICISSTQLHINVTLFLFIDCILLFVEVFMYYEYNVFYFVL